MCGMQWPVRITEHLSGQQDRVGLSSGDDRFRLVRIGDQADGASGDLRLAPDSFGERHLIAGGDRNICFRRRSAAGAIDQIDAKVV